MSETINTPEANKPKVEIITIDVEGEKVEAIAFSLDQFDVEAFDTKVQDILTKNSKLADKNKVLKFKFVICDRKVIVAPLKSPANESVHHRMLFGEENADKIQDAGAINIKTSEHGFDRLLGGFSSEYHHKASNQESFEQFREEHVKPNLREFFKVLDPDEKMD